MASRAANGTVEVDAFLADFDHPLKAEVEALRAIVTGVDPDITEQIKWAAPSFACGDHIATLNLRDRRRLHLVFHNPRIAEVDSDLLEGDHPDRRMAYFADMEDLRAKEGELRRVVADVVRRDRAG